eukprot:13912473-Ditylum_brightwellii.AAC.1
MAEEIPELGEQTGRQQLPEVHHQTADTSSGQHKQLTWGERREGDGCDSHPGQGVPFLGHADEVG